MKTLTVLDFASLTNSGRILRFASAIIHANPGAIEFAIGKRLRRKRVLLNCSGAMARSREGLDHTQTRRRRLPNISQLCPGIGPCNEQIAEVVVFGIAIRAGKRLLPDGRPPGNYPQSGFVQTGFEEIGARSAFCSTRPLATGLQGSLAVTSAGSKAADPPSPLQESKVVLGFS